MTREILIVEDDPGVAAIYQKILGPAIPHRTVWAQDGNTGLKLALERDFDLVITDFRMEGIDGLQLIQEVHRKKPSLPVILITVSKSSEIAINAMRQGAYDCLTKPVSFFELIDVVKKALFTSADLPSIEKPREPEEEGSALVGSSRNMTQLFKEIGRIAATPVTVLIRGETGTGKELVAQALYQHSDRNDKPFVAVNCAAIPETLLESELFGNEKGAFTGAQTRRIGRFEEAHHGTLFLDEIGELSPGTQSKLLRALQERVIQRLGSNETIPIDVRILAATHRNLEEAIPRREFREDLYYRLGDATLLIPPLRERREDIPALVAHFVTGHSLALNIRQPHVQPEAVAYLQDLDWPGNVRQLQSFIRQAILASRGYAITLEIARSLLPPSPSNKKKPAPFREYARQILERAAADSHFSAYAHTIREAETELLSQAIQLSAGNQSLAARWLGISRPTLRTKLNDLGVQGEEYEDRKEPRKTDAEILAEFRAHPADQDGTPIPGNPLPNGVSPKAK